jgi:hypothetical protein
MQVRPEQTVVASGPYFAAPGHYYGPSCPHIQNPFPARLFAADFCPGRLAQAVQGIRPIESAFASTARMFYSPRER